MWRFLESLPARCIDSVRIHRISFEVRGGINGVLKRRKIGMGMVIRGGNIFLRLANSGIRMFPSARQWQQFEAATFALCHPNRHVSMVDSNAIFFERISGRSLRDLAAAIELTDEVLVLAAYELRRAHALRDPRRNAAWSHGDPHLANFLFDESVGRCHIIDFETMHFSSLTESWRHADDLLVFCLELLGHPKIEHAARSAATFVHAYDRPEITGLLLERLRIPSGFERILWQTRTNYLPRSQLLPRIAALRDTLD